MKFFALRVRPHPAWVIGEVVAVAALAALVVWLSSAIQDKRRQIAVVQTQVDQQLAGAGETAALKTVVDVRQTDISALMSHVPTEDDIGKVVAILEGEAKKHGLTLQIPVVEEASAGTAEGEVVTEGGVLRDVRLSVAVTGPARAVLQFFHAAEHLPYLSRVEAWKFSTDEAGTLSGVQVSAPESVPGGGTPAPSLTQAAAAELTMDLYLTIHPANVP